MYKILNGWTKERMKETIRTKNTGVKADDSNGYCLYETEDGNHCAVGCFLPKNIIDTPRWYNNLPLNSMMRAFPELEKTLPLDVAGMCEMQGIHDIAPDVSDDIHKRLSIWIDKNVTE